MTGPSFGQLPMSTDTTRPGRWCPIGAHRLHSCHRSPVVFDVRCAFGWGTDAELDDPEPMLLVELTGGIVFLVRVELQPGRMQRLRKENESRPPAFSPLGGVDEHPIDVGTRHREKGDNLVVARTDPD